MSNHRKVLEEAVKATLTCRGIRNIQHIVATSEQTKKKIVLLLTKRNSKRRWKTHRTFPLVSFDYNFNCLSIFIHSN